MKQQFECMGGILEIETANGKTTAILTDADGNTSLLEEVTVTATLTDEQIERISHRFGLPRKDGQPF